jgi:hypothetical protein
MSGVTARMARHTKREGVMMRATRAAVVAALVSAAAASGTTARAANLQSWDTKIESAKSRFVVLQKFDGDAVLDRETQLVWQRKPDLTRREWGAARSFCYGLRLGGRGGWRLPQMEELTTLIDPDRSFPPLPDGHPFDISNLGRDVWSASSSGPDFAFSQDMRNHGFLGGGDKETQEMHAWCVRGGRGVEGQ